MIHKRKEGSCIRNGINYCKTKFGHSILIRINNCVLGYYSGKKFSVKYWCDASGNTL